MSVYQELDKSHIEKNDTTLILFKIFDIYLCHYFTTNKKIATTHLWYAMEPQTMYHLIAKYKVAEQLISRKNSNCNKFLSSESFTQGS